MAATLLLLVALIQQPTDAFTGDWIGKVNDKPVMLLTITNDGTVAGQVVSFFYSNQSGEWKQSDWRRLPMLNPSVVGNTLSFALAPLNTQTGENKPSECLPFAPATSEPPRGSYNNNREPARRRAARSRTRWAA